VRRIIVCGDREWDDREYLERELDAYHARYPIDVVIQGRARGADAMAEAWARERGIAVMPFEADWRRYRYGAGPIRNGEMLNIGRPCAVIAFHRDLTRSKGTASMVGLARAAGVPTYVIPFEGERPWEAEDAALDLAHQRMTQPDHYQRWER
jgi:hypothetical protein